MLSFFKNFFGPATDFKSLYEQGAIIIDVRTNGEFSSGHIKDAINIPVDRINSQLNDIRKKGKPVITCCASGMRSSSAASMLKKAGIEAYNGGSWVSLNTKLD